MREVKSLSRGLQIMESLVASDNGLSNKEIAEQHRVDKSVVSRFVYTLMINGYAERDDDTGRYKAGSKIVRLSNKLLSRIHLRDQAKPYLQRLSEETRENAHLGILAPAGVLIIDQVKSDFKFQVTAEVGTIAQLHSTAIGKAVLAFSDIPMPDKLVCLTPRTITDRAILEAHLSMIRNRGYAIDDEEDMMGVRCIAAPVFGISDKLLGAIGISGPATRVTQDRIQEFAAITLAVANDLSDRMRFE